MVYAAVLLYCLASEGPCTTDTAEPVAHATVRAADHDAAEIRAFDWLRRAIRNRPDHDINNYLMTLKSEGTTP